MNIELKLGAIVRRKKPHYKKGIEGKAFANLINQDFSADKKNTLWCTDFTYLPLSNGEMRYNCTIIDLYDRSVIASITDNEITSDLAIRTLRKGIIEQHIVADQLIIHSDQGSQFTSKAFTEFCESAGVKQSMSKPGYPYDNAPMERFFNTLKNEYTKWYSFKEEKQLYSAVEWFAYAWYNHGRPHSRNGYLTPFEARNR